jgi:hypothetical protein
VKILKYNIGDIVRLKKIVGHYGSGKGCVRGASLARCVGHLGIIRSTYTSSNRGYNYYVQFDIPYKRPNKKGEKSRLMFFYLMEQELDPLFIA